jgi:hypothetical protein
MMKRKEKEKKKKRVLRLNLDSPIFIKLVVKPERDWRARND